MCKVIRLFVIEPSLVDKVCKTGHGHEYDTLSLYLLMILRTSTSWLDHKGYDELYRLQLRSVQYVLDILGFVGY